MLAVITKVVTKSFIFSAVLMSSFDTLSALDLRFVYVACFNILQYAPIIAPIHSNALMRREQISSLRMMDSNDVFFRIHIILRCGKKTKVRCKQSCAFRSLKRSSVPSFSGIFSAIIYWVKRMGHSLCPHPLCPKNFAQIWKS